MYTLHTHTCTYTQVVRMCEYLKQPKFASKYDSVPDPYYGGAAGFELV